MSDLLYLARRILEQATTGEEVEVYVSHGRETSVRVFEGAIEQLETAESAGVGIRVISEGRQGFSYVGALDESAANEALIEACDNARFATVDKHAGLASPDGVKPPMLDLWREELVSFPTDDRVALALGSSAGYEPGTPVSAKSSPRTTSMASAKRRSRTPRDRSDR